MSAFLKVLSSVAHMFKSGQPHPTHCLWQLDISAPLALTIQHWVPVSYGIAFQPPVNGGSLISKL